MNTETLDLLDRIEHDVEAFADSGPISLEDAPDVAKILRRINRQIWGQINTVEAMIYIPILDVVNEAEQVGLEALLEAGALRVDSKGWWRWNNK